MSDKILALGMIVYNEINLVENILEKINLYVDEIIIVVDNPTKEMMSDFKILTLKYDCIIIPSNGDESERRNLYLENSSCSWLITIDSDELISKENIIEIKKFLSTLDNNIGAVRLPIINYFGYARWTTTFFPKLIKINSKIRYNNSIQHTSVSDSVTANGLKMSRYSKFIEHYGSLINKSELMKHQKRIQDLEQMIMKNQCSSFIYSMLALEYICVGMYEIAHKNISMALNKPGDRSFAIYLEALIYHRFHAHYLSKQKLEDILKTTVFTSEAAILLADLYIIKNDIISAEEKLKPFIEMHPDTPHLLINYAEIIKDVDPNMAIEYLERAISILPALKERKIYLDGAAYSPYFFQDNFLHTYTNVFVVLEQAYRKIGKIKDANFWNEHKNKLNLNKQIGGN